MYHGFEPAVKYFFVVDTNFFSGYTKIESKLEENPVITNSKKVLCRLMAEENIIVEERDCTTAYFDVYNRLLVIPIFKEDVSETVTDLIIAHEIGHALYTKAEDWTDAIFTRKLNKTIVNVLEDKRIEDLIKKKYPGLKSIFNKGYKELQSMDFFGLSNIDIDDLNLVDKINLYNKIGFIPGVDFDEEEQEYLHKCENITSFEDVLNLAEEIQTYMKEKFASMDANDIRMKFGYDDSFDVFDDIDSSDEQEEKNVNALDSTEEENALDSTEEEQEEKSEYYFKGSLLEELEEDYIKSKTDENFSIGVLELFENDSIPSLYVDVPNYDLNDIIVDYKTLFLKLKNSMSYFDQVIINDEFEDFKTNNYATVNHLLKEFRLKKNAIVRRKIKESSTGNINPNKLYSYKFEKNIFKKNHKKSKEQSHSMIFYLDWSGSMTNVMSDTISNLLALVMFCKKQGIPYEVYAFTSAYTEEPMVYNTNEAIIHPLKLLNILSSRMSINEFNNMASVLIKYRPLDYNNSFKNKNGAYIDTIPHWLMLHGTPLNHTILLSNRIAKAYKERTRTNIVNNIFLTDGESHGISFTRKFNGYISHTSIADPYVKVYLRDRINGSVQKVKKNNMFDETNSCIDFIKQSGDIKMFGFRIIDNKQLKERCFSLFGDYDSSSKWSTLKKEKILKVNNTSYDEFYLIKGKDKETNENEMVITENMTTAAISKQFSKMLKYKIDNKTLLTSFINFIS